MLPVRVLTFLENNADQDASCSILILTLIKRKKNSFVKKTLFLLAHFNENCFIEKIMK